MCAARVSVSSMSRSSTDCRTVRSKPWVDIAVSFASERGRSPGSACKRGGSTPHAVRSVVSRVEAPDHQDERLRDDVAVFPIGEAELVDLRDELVQQRARDAEQALVDHDGGDLRASKKAGALCRFARELAHQQFDRALGLAGRCLQLRRGVDVAPRPMIGSRRYRASPVRTGASDGETM